MSGDVILVGGALALVGVMLLFWPCAVWLARGPLRSSLLRLGQWLAAFERRRRRIGVVLALVGLLVAAAGYGAKSLQTHRRDARERAKLAEVANALEARLRMVAKIEEDAAARPPVMHTDVKSDPSRGALALHLPAVLRDYATTWGGPAEPECKAMRGVEPTRRNIDEMRRCMRAEVIAIVRERPKTKGLRFSGDALVYGTADGRYLGGVVLDIADEAGPMPLGYHAERRLRLAVTGRANAPVDLEK